MIEVYVSSACNLPSADRNGFSDPYAEVWFDETWTFILGRMTNLGKTQIIKKTLDPVWDANFSNPFRIPFVLASYLGFKLYDHDTLFDDYLGYAKIKITPECCNKVFTLPIEVSKATKGPPTITIKYCPPTTNFPIDLNYNNYRNIYAYITYSPSNPTNPSIFLDAYALEFSSSTTCYSLSKGRGFYMSSKSRQHMHIGPTGLTDVFYLDTKKFGTHNYTNDFIIFFVATTQNYTGEVTLNLLGAPHERRDDNLCRKLKNPELYKLINTSTMHVDANQHRIFPLCIHYLNKIRQFE